VLPDLISSPGTDPQARVVLALRQRGVLSRAEVARATGLAKSTVSETVAELIDSGLIVKTSTVRRSRRNGRPGTGITLNPQAGMYVGLDFGFRHVRGVLADVSHRILATREMLIGLDYSTDMGLTAAKELVDELLREGGVTPERVLGIGIAIPGPVDPETGKVMGTSMIPTWAGVDIAAEFGALFGNAVFVDNESNCAALSEHLWGAGVGYSNLAYVKLHSGVGGAIVMNGALVHGLAGAAGEFGHITIDDTGPLCRCGGRGCLEAYVGIPALLADLRPTHGEITFTQFLELVRAEDLPSLRVLADAAEAAGRMVAVVSSVCAPSRVIVGGALADAGDALLEPLRASFARQSILTRRGQGPEQMTEIVAGSLGRHASSLGAVALVLTRLGLGSDVSP
jgi:predicted NBD/HSP70 family sugar kinase